MPKPALRALAGGGLSCLVLLLGCYLVFIQTSWGQRLDDAAYLGRAALRRRVVLFDSAILDAVTVGTIALGGLILVAVSVAVGRWREGIVAAIGWACAAASAEVLKAVLPRPVLTPLDAQVDAINTFPSGHTTISCSYVLAWLLISGPRLRPWLACAGGFAAACYSTGVLFAGWHRPSDALGGLLLSGAWFCAAGALAVRSWGRTAQVRTRWGALIAVSAGLALLIFGGAVYSANRNLRDFPDADAPFVVLSAAIVALSFAITVGYAWALRGVSWTRTPDPARRP